MAVDESGQCDEALMEHSLAQMGDDTLFQVHQSIEHGRVTAPCNHMGVAAVVLPCDLLLHRVQRLLCAQNSQFVMHSKLHPPDPLRLHLLAFLPACCVNSGTLWET